MTRIEIQTRIIELKNELENRHKYGTVKIADNNNDPIPAEKLQEEMFKLIYRLSKFD